MFQCSSIPVFHLIPIKINGTLEFETIEFKFPVPVP